MDIREYRDSDPEERERALDVLRAGLEEQAPYTGESDYAERTLSRLDRKRDWGLSRWWVAVGDDGDIVGVMVMQFDAYECAPLGNCAYLQEVDVVQSAQGRGVGRRLVARAEQEARAAGMDAVLSGTHAGNARSRDFHAACGFDCAPEECRAPEGSGLVTFSKLLGRRPRAGDSAC